MINKIRERLSKITPPPWHIEHTIAAPEIGNGERKIAKALYYGGSEDNEVDANADFIANAPTDIAFLLSEVERLTAELDGYKEDVLVFIGYSKERPCALCSRPNESPYMCVECRDKNNWEYCRVEVYHEQE